VYDAGGGSAGRYTAVFTGLYDLKSPGEYPYLSMDEGAAGDVGSLRRGRPRYERMGREIRFEDLPEAYRAVALDFYRRLWNL
jgi:hypothetical protein